MNILSRSFTRCLATIVLLALTLPPPVSAEPTKAGKQAKERELIGVLQSSAAPSDKALACKQLAVWGTREAVPTLAGLLADEQLASWARIALEAIPDPACDKALRKSLDKLQGRFLVGVIDSIGVRRDSKAVSALARSLKSPDLAVAAAAADSLGRIGGNSAARALKAQLANPSAAVRDAAASGCIRCAERFAGDGKRGNAIKLYDVVRAANVPKQRTLEATRGSILARQAAGIPLLVEQLRASDKAAFGMALRTARELPGKETDAALASEIRRATPERQPLLLLALADRGDAATQPAVLEAARTGSRSLRLTAVKALDRAANPAALPTLLAVAGGDDADLSQAAKSAVVRLPGKSVDADLLARLPQAEAKLRPALLDIAGRRGMEPALPWMMSCVGDPDPATRKAALKAIGLIGGKPQLPDLAKLLAQAKPADAREEISQTLVAISSRLGTDSVEALLPLAQSPDPALRLAGLQALAAAGGRPALEAVVKTTNEDPDEGVRDEAVRTLANWPSTWPEDAAVCEPLLALAGSSSKTSHQVLAARGFLQFLQGDKKLGADDKLAKLNQILPLLKRPEEKLLAISVLREIRKPEALQLLSGFVAEPGVTEESCSELLNLAESPKGSFPLEARQAALRLVTEKSANESTRKRAEAALKKLQ